MNNGGSEEKELSLSVSGGDPGIIVRTRDLGTCSVTAHERLNFRHIFESFQCYPDSLA
jgi:hypothetical protein